MQLTRDSQIQYMTIVILTTIMMFAVVGFFFWMRERRRDMVLRREEQDRQHEHEQKRLDLEEKRVAIEEHARYEASRQAEDQVLAQSSGAGSGGYIVVEMPEKERPLFHDLLKGFEDYAKLKGYHIAFSIDASHDGRIAFKFTVKNDGFVVGPERVRQDFKEYVEQVKNKDIDDLDGLPVITSLEEHNLLVTQLKNRISFLQHSYNLSQNAVKYYESLITNVRTFPALPAPTVVVQTGGTMDSRNYHATNSSRLIQGDANAYADSSVNIGNSFNERQERIKALDDVIEKIKASDAKDEPTIKAQRELGKVRDELTEYSEPDKSSVKKWLEYAKNMMSTAALGLEVTEAAKKLWELFGV
jgi:hypothetical protein